MIDNGKTDGGGRNGDKDNDMDNDTDDVDVGSNEVLPGGGFKETTVQPVYGSKNLRIVMHLSS